MGIIVADLLDTIPLKSTDSLGGQNWVITARSVEKLQNDSEGAGGPYGVGGVGNRCPCSLKEDAYSPGKVA